MRPTCDVDPTPLEQLGLTQHVLLVLPVGEAHNARLDTVHGARLNPPDLKCEEMRLCDTGGMMKIGGKPVET